MDDNGFLRTFSGLGAYGHAMQCRDGLAFLAEVVEGPEAGDWSVMDREQALECGFIDDEPSDSSLESQAASDRHIMAVTAPGVR